MQFRGTVNACSVKAEAEVKLVSDMIFFQCQDYSEYLLKCRRCTKVLKS